MTVFSRAAVSILAFLMLLPAMALGQTTWTGAAGDGLWSTAGNWSLGLPTATTDAVIPAGAGAVSVTTTVNVRNLSTSRPINVGPCGAELNINGNLTLNSVNITFAMQNCGGITFAGGSPATPTSQSILGTGELIATSGSRLAVGQFTTLNITTNISVRADAASFGISLSTASILNNAGTLRTANATRAINVSGVYNATTPANSSQFNNTGTVQVDGSANFTIATLPWTNTGTFSVSNGATLNLGGRYSSLGSFSRTGVTTVTLEGTYLGSTLTTTAATGPLVVTFTAAQPVTFNATGGQITTIGGATLTSPTFDSPVTVIGTATVTSPTFNAPATFTACSAALTISAGNLTLNAANLTFNTQNCGGLSFSQGTSATPATQNIIGTGELISGNGVSVSVGAYTTLNIPSGITCRADAGNFTINLSTASTLNNGGTFRSSGTGRTFTINGQYSAVTPANNSQFNNTGSVLVDTSAIFNINTTPWANSGTYSLASNSTLNLAGRYASLGTLSRTGTTTVNLDGAFLGTTFVTSNATGPISFAGDTTNVTFSAIDGQVVTMRGGTHTSPVFSSPTNITGTVNVSNPTFNAAATMTACGATLVVNGGNLTLNAANLTFNTQNCGGLTFNQGTLASPATQSILGTGELISGNGAVLSVSSYTTLNVASGITCRASAGDLTFSLLTASVLNNAGTFRTSGVSRNFTVSGNYSAATPANSSQFNNTGTVLADTSASFSISTLPWTNSGTYSVATNGTLSLAGRYNSLGSISRTGTTTVNADGTFLGSSFVTTAATGPLNIGFSAPQPVTFSASGGQVTTLTNATLTSPTFNSVVTVTGSNFASNPTFNASATFAACGASLTVTSGNLTLNAANLTFNTQNCGGLSFTQGTGAVPATQSIVGTGELISGSGVTFGPGNFTSLNIAPGITCRADSGNMTINLSVASALNNAGTLRTSGANRLLSIAGVYNATTPANSSQFNNTGTVLAENSATFSISTMPWTNGGTFSANTGAILNLGGRYTALGTISRAAPSTINLSGTFVGSAFSASPATGNLVLSTDFTGVNFTTSGGATLTFSGGTHTNCNYNSPVNFSGTVTATGAVFNADATFSPCGAGLIIPTGNLTLNNAVLSFSVQNCGMLSFSQGTAAVPATQSILGTGTLRTVANGGTITLVTATTLNIPSGITLRGEGAGLTFSMSPSSQINNAGTVSCSGQGAFLSLGGNNPTTNITNSGTILVEDRATANLSSAVTNTGILSASSGARIDVGGNTTQTAPGRLRIISTGSLPSTGIGRVNVLNGATYTISGSTLEILSTGPDPCRGEAVILSTNVGAPVANLVGTFGTTLLPPGLSNAQAILTINGTTYSYRQTNPSDIAGANQSVGSDGVLTADDIIVYLGWFFANTTGNPASPTGLRADVAGPNQSVIPDGFLTADDIIVFLARYFAGCS